MPAAQLLETDVDVVGRLTRELREAARQMGRDEARYLVNAYYTMQDDRKRTGNQNKANDRAGQPPMPLVEWLEGYDMALECRIKSLLGEYAKAQPAGAWAQSICGIGPVISAGLLAHIDIEQAPTVGHIWRFAGYDPTVKWLGNEGAKAVMAEVVGRQPLTLELILEAIRRTNRNPENVARQAVPKAGGEVTRASLTAALARRPWNADLKVLCYKIGESFIKTQNLEDDIYGHVFVERKLYEWEKNLAGDYAPQALECAKSVGRETGAIIWNSGRLTAEAARGFYDCPLSERVAYPRKHAGQPGSGVPMLSPGHINARARRYAVKLFLSHFHHVLYESTYHTRPPMPYVLEHGGHTHFVAPPNWPMS